MTLLGNFVRTTKSEKGGQIRVAEHDSSCKRHTSSAMLPGICNRFHRFCPFSLAYAFLNLSVQNFPAESLMAYSKTSVIAQTSLSDDACFAIGH